MPPKLLSSDSDDICLYYYSSSSSTVRLSWLRRLLTCVVFLLVCDYMLPPIIPTIDARLTRKCLCLALAHAHHARRHSLRTTVSCVSVQPAHVLSFKIRPAIPQLSAVRPRHWLPWTGELCKT